MDPIPDDRRTPGLPGLLAEFQWVDSPDYGGRPENRRGLRVYDVDPAPLARLVATKLGITGISLAEAARAVADDERDGPIHIAHLAAACEYAAAQTGGSLSFVTGGASGDPFADLCKALHDEGLAGAASAARAISPHDRADVLAVLLSYLVAPFTGLVTDLRDDMIRPR
jgi:hypothetical protein